MRRTFSFKALAGFAVAVILLAAGGLLLWGSTYVHNTVRSQLAALPSSPTSPRSLPLPSAA